MKLHIKNDHMRQHNYLFVHIPKTGGRSVLSAMNVKFHCEHKSLQEYIKDLGEQEIINRYKFTIVRNPWDRAVSWYRFFYRPMLNEAPLTFNQWILRNRWGRIHKRTDNPSFNRPKIPLDILSYCRNAAGEILIDKFLTFENLNKDFEEVAMKLGVSPTLPYIGKGEQKNSIQQTKHLLKANKTGVSIPVNESLNYRDLYESQESIDIIANMNRELIERFNYTF